MCCAHRAEQSKAKQSLSSLLAAALQHDRLDLQLPSHDRCTLHASKNKDTAGSSYDREKRQCTHIQILIQDIASRTYKCKEPWSACLILCNMALPALKPMAFSWS